MSVSIPQPVFERLRNGVSRHIFVYARVKCDQIFVGRKVLANGPDLVRNRVEKIRK